MSIAHQYQRISKVLHILLNVKCYFKTCKLLQKALKDDCVFFLPASLGDTLFVLSNLKRIERTKGITITPVLKPSHIPIAGLCHCEKYIVSPVPSVPYFYFPLTFKFLWFAVKSLFKKKPPQLKKGNAILAHPNYYDYFADLFLKERNESFNDCFSLFFDIPGLRMSQLTDLLPVSCSIGYDYNKMIVLCPECNTDFPLFSSDFWNSLASLCKSMGYDVYYNASRESTYLQNAVRLNCAWQDILGICQRAAFVVSFRSGLCDLLAHKGSRLLVLYPPYNFPLHKKLKFSKTIPAEKTHRPIYPYFSLNLLFGRNDIPEFVFPQDSPDPLPVADYIQKHR